VAVRGVSRGRRHECVSAYAPGVTEVIVRATAVRWVDDAFPGWIEVTLNAVDGHTHRIVEKVPVLTNAEITADTTFPFELWVRGASSRVDRNAAEVTLAYDVVTTEGLATLTIVTKDVVWL
jgi:hypothetical protein